MLIDTHCHLSLEDYENIDEIVERMGRNIMIISGVDDITNKEVMTYVDKYPNVYGMVGIHPGNIEKIKGNSFSMIEKYLKHPKIVGVGEIGLDYHYPNINKERQKEIFAYQIEIAKKYKKTIIVHSRDAYLDTYNIIKEHYIPGLKIVMHCYSYSLESAEELIKLGVKFGIGGTLTFKNSKKIQEIVKKIDIGNFLLETDSPYLTPVPFRGTKNEPSYVKYVAEKMAELKNLSTEEVILMTTKNAISQFDLPYNI